MQSPSGGQRHILASSPVQKTLRFGGLGWHGVGDLGTDRRFHFSPVPPGSLPLPPSLHTGFPPRLNAQGQLSLRDGAWEWSEEGGGDGSGEACINTCKFSRKDRFPCKTTCVCHAPHPTPTNTDVLPVIVLGGILWALRMPSQGGRLLTYRAMRSSPEVCMGQDSRVCFSTPPTPSQPPPSRSPPCEARSLFVILHKSAAIKMHWSRTALGRHRLAFPGQRPASLHSQWGLFLKVNAFSLSEGKGLPLKRWGGGRERDTPPFPSPFCSSPRSRPFASHIQGEQEESPQLGQEGAGGGPNLFRRGN